MLLFAFMMISALSVQMLLRDALPGTSLTARQLEIEMARRDFARYVDGYKAYLANVEGHPFPRAEEIFPVYGFNPPTRESGRSTIFRQTGSGQMTVCYVPRNDIAQELKADLGQGAELAPASACPVSAGAAAADGAVAVFYYINPAG